MVAMIVLWGLWGCICVFRRPPSPLMRELAAKYSPIVITGRVVYRNCDKVYPYIFSPNKLIYRKKKEMYLIIGEKFNNDTLTIMLDNELICRAIFTSDLVWGITLGTIVLPLDTVNYRWICIKDNRDSMLYRIELVGVTDRLLVRKGRKDWYHEFFSGPLQVE